MSYFRLGGASIAIYGKFDMFDNYGDFNQMN